jgi:hypothetical protein
LSLHLVLEQTIISTAALWLLVPSAAMRPFVSSFGSRADDHLNGSARGSCSPRGDETVYLSVLFSGRRSFGRQSGTEREISAVREHLGSATNDLSLHVSMREV